MAGAQRQAPAAAGCAGGDPGRSPHPRCPPPLPQRWQQQQQQQQPQQRQGAHRPLLVPGGRHDCLAQLLCVAGAADHAALGGAHTVGGQGSSTLLLLLRRAVETGGG